MGSTTHDPVQFLRQLRQTLAADKLPVGFFMGAGCPCAVVTTGEAETVPLIPDVRGLTRKVAIEIAASTDSAPAYEALMKTFAEDSLADPTVEAMLNRVRSFQAVAGASTIRGLARDALVSLDREICKIIRVAVSKDLPEGPTPYAALANYVGNHKNPCTEIFTTNYDVLIEQALERSRVPYFDGFIGSSRPFFDQRAIEDEEASSRWARLWKLHGSINWRFNSRTKAVFRSEANDGDELLIHPSHLKYDESRRMPYFVMLDRLRSYLRRGSRPVALFVIGYSFGDDHLNEVIVESLKSNPSAACFALQYSDLAGYPAAAALAKDNANLSLLCRDKAIVRKSEGPWLASPDTDTASLSEVFELVSASENVDEKPRPVNMRLGDFKQFGVFLDSFSQAGIAP